MAVRGNVLTTTTELSPATAELTISSMMTERLAAVGYIETLNRMNWKLA